MLKDRNLANYGQIKDNLPISLKENLEIKKESIIIIIKIKDNNKSKRALLAIKTKTISRNTRVIIMKLMIKKLNR